mmetsp:Transcript_86824/g.156385  ORF Transcript_86824/g.156385 Transcript_86824/m.156385 type:complete len:238 (+) Transcript_86824:735-1448(+)
MLKGQPSLLGGLAVVSDGILEDFTCFAIHGDLGALEGDLEGVAVQLLQQRTTATEGDVGSRHTLFLEAPKDLWDGDVVNAVALDDADVRRQKLVASLCDDDVFLELLKQDLHDRDAGLFGVAAVRAHDQLAELAPILTDAPLDEVLELRAPVFPASLEDVEGVADTCNQTFRILLEHVLHGVYFAVYAPRGDCGVLRRWDGESNSPLGPIVLHAGNQRHHGVGAQEIDQMTQPAQGG